MDVTMTSNSSKKGSNNNIVAASSQHQEHQEAMDTAPQAVEARRVKQTQQHAATGEPKPRSQLDEVLRCPRCGSNNTKFCYYNNCKTSQPRYFCRACRRYWTQGGTLRSVPIGGRCHKKRSSACLLPSSSSSSIDNQQQQQQKQKQMVPVSSTTEQQDFPNMLPASSTGFELPGTQLSPLIPLSLPSLVPEPPLPLTFGSEMSFVDLLGGGFPGDHQGSNNNNGATSSDMDTKWLIGYYGDDASPIGGGGAALQGDQWFTTTQVGADQKKQEGGESAPDTASAK